MAKRHASRVSMAALVLVGVTRFLDAQEPIRLGVEFQVNSYTQADQVQPVVARDGAGAFVVVWLSEGQDGAGYGVFARRFDAAGMPLATEFRVNTYTPGFQYPPAVARTAGGGFVVAWGSGGQDGDQLGVFARRFNAAGTALAAEFQVNTRTAGLQYEPAVEFDADGDFVVVWSSTAQDGSMGGIFGRRFSSSGAALGTEFAINAYTSNAQNNPDVGLDADGDFVVVWRSFHDGDSYGIFSRRFDSAGSPGAEFQVNTLTAATQFEPGVAIDADGDAVVVWRSVGAVFARRLDQLGAPQATEFQVNASSIFFRRYPRVDMDAAGRFVVAWQSYGQDGSYDGVFARHFDASGVPRGNELQVNTRTLEFQIQADVAMDGDGDFVVAWSSEAQDGSEHGVFGQRFSTPAVLDIDGNGDVAALTDGILALRFMFGFTGASLTGGAVGDGCTRCNAAAIEPYLQGLV